MEVKIFDFNVSKIMQWTLDPCNSYVGMCAYKSPERVNPNTYRSGYDGMLNSMWSLLYIDHFRIWRRSNAMIGLWWCAPCGLESRRCCKRERQKISRVQCYMQKDLNKRCIANKQMLHNSCWLYWIKVVMIELLSPEWFGNHSWRWRFLGFDRCNNFFLKCRRRDRRFFFWTKE